MRAIAIHVDIAPNGTGGRATVVLRPCWLARLFGARERAVELQRTGSGSWRSVNTDSPLHELDHGRQIRNALDFRPRGELPCARAL